VFVFVDEAAEQVGALELRIGWRSEQSRASVRLLRWTKCKSRMGPMAGVDAEHMFELAAAEDEESIETVVPPQKCFFRQLGIEIETDEVKQVRELRNFLTHRRGELRTEEQRKQYREDHPDEFLPLAVALTTEGVIASMDQLAEAVRTIDACVYEYTWGRASLPGLHP
jgi:hypothetical protein